MARLSGYRPAVRPITIAVGRRLVGSAIELRNAVVAVATVVGIAVASCDLQLLCALEDVDPLVAVVTMLLELRRRVVVGMRRARLQK